MSIRHEGRKLLVAALVSALAATFVGCHSDPAEGVAEASSGSASPVVEPEPSRSALAQQRTGDGSGASLPEPANGDDPVGTEASSTDADIDSAIDTILGDHIAYRRVFDGFTKAVANDSAADAALFVRFPVDVDINGENVVIDDAASFARLYDSFMTPAIRKAIAETRYSDVMVNDQGVMLGQGEAWISGICRDDTCKNVSVAVITIQAGIP